VAEKNTTIFCFSEENEECDDANNYIMAMAGKFDESDAVKCDREMSMTTNL
jgi:hypothetical protein